MVRWPAALLWSVPDSLRLQTYLVLEREGSQPAQQTRNLVVHPYVAQSFHILSLTLKCHLNTHTERLEGSEALQY